MLGGLVPELLTRGQGDETPAHLGTTDIDIHITLVPDPESGLSALEAALEAIDAEPDPKIDGWRWLIPIEGTRVKIEFLCDLEDRPANETIPLPGCHQVKAANLRGTGFVARDWVEEEIERTTDGETSVRRARFAGLEGYLMAKSYAVRSRGADKDYYDLVHVLLYNREDRGSGLRCPHFEEPSRDACDAWGPSHSLPGGMAGEDGLGVCYEKQH